MRASASARRASSTRRAASSRVSVVSPRGSPRASWRASRRTEIEREPEDLVGLAEQAAGGEARSFAEQRAPHVRLRPRVERIVVLGGGDRRPRLGQAGRSTPGVPTRARRRATESAAARQSSSGERSLRSRARRRRVACEPAPAQPDPRSRARSARRRPSRATRRRSDRGRRRARRPARPDRPPGRRLGRARPAPAPPTGRRPGGAEDAASDRAHGAARNRSAPCARRGRPVEPRRTAAGRSPGRCPAPLRERRCRQAARAARRPARAAPPAPRSPRCGCAWWSRRGVARGNRKGIRAASAGAARCRTPDRPAPPARPARATRGADCGRRPSAIRAASRAANRSD